MCSIIYTGCKFFLKTKQIIYTQIILQPSVWSARQKLIVLPNSYLRVGQLPKLCCPTRVGQPSIWSARQIVLPNSYLRVGQLPKWCCPTRVLELVSQHPKLCCPTRVFELVSPRFDQQKLTCPSQPNSCFGVGQHPKLCCPTRVFELVNPRFDQLA